jgi:hypothetical protein
MSRIAELENLIAVARIQRTKANRLNVRAMVQSINHDLQNWSQEPVTLKVGA